MKTYHIRGIIEVDDDFEGESELADTLAQAIDCELATGHVMCLDVLPETEGL